MNVYMNEYNKCELNLINEKYETNTRFLSFICNVSIFPNLINKTLKYHIIRVYFLDLR